MVDSQGNSARCPSCGGTNWRNDRRFKTINPNGEYVEGYGHSFVSVSIDFWVCGSCGWYEGASLKHINLKGEEVVPLVEAK